MTRLYRMGAKGTHHTSNGFTLIELSIVLVIIGLIVGGVLAGRYLIRAAELQSIITDETKYITAVNTFRTKYNELPGDMTDATNYWGTNQAGCPGGYTAALFNQGTCNGNGNGLIENDGTGASGGVNMYENYYAWQHLADAGLIQGAYSGSPGPASWADDVPGFNVPTTKYPNGGFEWAAFNASGSNVGLWTWGSTPYLQYNAQYLMVGARQPGGGFDLVTPLLPPSDAQAIDAKMDDGMPLTGTVIAPNIWDSNGNCINGYPTPPVYNMTTTSQINATLSPYCVLLLQVKSW